MKALLFIFLGFSFFIIHCGPMEEEEGTLPLDEVLRNFNSEIFDDPDTEAEIRNDEGGEAEDQAVDITEELESVEPRFVREDKGFYADDFETQEFYSCTKEGEKSYVFELYEEPDDNPYVCYLIHRYKNCGKSYSAEKGYCYHSAVKQKGFCRAHLEKNLNKRKGQGYLCELVEKAMQEKGSVESDSDGQQNTAVSEQ